jgi:hypothetical protein
LSNTYQPNSALYAHKIHSGFWHDVNKPESFGFAAHQVTPFNVSTPDNEVLYAWHILPLATVAANRDALAAADPLDQTLPLQLLKSDPEARVIVNCKSSHLFVLTLEILMQKTSSWQCRTCSSRLAYRYLSRTLKSTSYPYLHNRLPRFWPQHWITYGNRSHHRRPRSSHLRPLPRHSTLAYCYSRSKSRNRRSHSSRIEFLRPDFCASTSTSCWR